MDAGAVGLELVFHQLFYGSVVLTLIHIDEVDDDKTGKVTQAQLTRDFCRGLKVGLCCRLFNRTFFGGATGVHVNRNKRFGRVDHDVAARWQLHSWVKHARQVAFDLVTRKQRHLFFVVYHVLSVGWHDHFHEILGRAVTALALDNHFVDLFRIQIADRALDQVAFFVDLRWCGRPQRQFANLFP